MKHTAGILAEAAMVTASIEGAAAATPPSGIVTAPIIGRGHFTDDVQMKFKIKRHGTKPIRVSPKDPSEVVAQQITLAPDGHTGWHTHPGPAVVVKSGTMTLAMADRACSTHSFVRRIRTGWQPSLGPLGPPRGTSGRSFGASLDI